MAVLITPSWKGASWWPKVSEMRKAHIPLGCLSSEDTMGWQSRNEHAPAWTAFFDGVDDPLWAERIRTKYRNILLRFLVWQEYHGLETGTDNNKDNKKRGNEAKGIARFIRALTREVSGEAMLSNARSLLKTLRRHICTRIQRAIRAMFPVWRRDANMLNPPRRQAAEAVSMQTLKETTEKGRRDTAH